MGAIIIDTYSVTFLQRPIFFWKNMYNFLRVLLQLDVMSLHVMWLNVYYIKRAVRYPIWFENEKVKSKHFYEAVRYVNLEKWNDELWIEKRPYGPKRVLLGERTKVAIKCLISTIGLPSFSNTASTNPWNKKM